MIRSLRARINRSLTPLVLIPAMLGIVGCDDLTEQETPKVFTSVPPKVKLISYQDKFRRDYGEIAHLSLVVYFKDRPEFGISPYGCRYQLRHTKTGEVLTDEKKHDFTINPCQLGYTGVKQILDTPKGFGFFEEVVLKAKQTPVKPGRFSRDGRTYPVKDGEWWITGGLEYPSFNASEYEIVSVTFFDKETGEIKLKIGK